MDILCNIHTCRKPLNGTLWVTSCSHSFCETHASSLSQKNTKCPVCDTVLGKRFDVIRQNSNPAEDFRAMLLVGLRPEIILDIAMRAVSFWNYQMEQEYKYQSSSAKRLKEAVDKVKNNHAVLLRQLANAKKSSDNQEKQIRDLRDTVQLLKDQVASKDQQLQKMQHLLNSLKNKTHVWATSTQNTTEEINPQIGCSLPQHANRYRKHADHKPDFQFKPQLPFKKKDF